MHGEPAKLVRVVVDRTRGPRIPAERQQLEEIVAIDEIARIAPRREVQKGLQRLGTDRQVVEQRADVAGLEARRRNSSQRLDDALDGDQHQSSARRRSITRFAPARAIRAWQRWDNLRTGLSASQPTPRRFASSKTFGRGGVRMR